MSKVTVEDEHSFDSGLKNPYQARLELQQELFAVVAERLLPTDHDDVLRQDYEVGVGSFWAEKNLSDRFKEVFCVEAEQGAGLRPDVFESLKAMASVEERLHFVLHQMGYRDVHDFIEKNRAELLDSITAFQSTKPKVTGEFVRVGVDEVLKNAEEQGK